MTTRTAADKKAYHHAYYLAHRDKWAYVRGTHRGRKLWTRASAVDAGRAFHATTDRWPQREELGQRHGLPSYARLALLFTGGMREWLDLCAGGEEIPAPLPARPYVCLMCEKQKPELCRLQRICSGCHQRVAMWEVDTSWMNGE